MAARYRHLIVSVLCLAGERASLYPSGLAATLSLVIVSWLSRLLIALHPFSERLSAHRLCCRPLFRLWRCGTGCLADAAFLNFPCDWAGREQSEGLMLRRSCSGVFDPIRSGCRSITREIQFEAAEDDCVQCGC